MKQVLLYWEGHFTSPFAAAGDNSITINGTPVAGTLIGGPTAFYSHRQWSGPSDPDDTENFSTYRADITSRNLVSAGSNTLTVTDMLFQSRFEAVNGFTYNAGNDGVGVLVIYDDGGAEAAIEVRDGSDLAFRDFASPLNTTVPQTFTFAASTTPRVATLATLAASVKGPDFAGFRGSTIRLTFAPGGETADLTNIWQSHQGYEFDAENTAVTIPAGASSLTVQALSTMSATDVWPASLAWVGAALSVPPVQPAALGDFVWHDLNANGIQDAGEPGIGGVTVRLLDCAGNVLQTTTTDASGLYLFSPLAPGGYTVEFVKPTGYSFSSADQGGNDAKDSDANATTGMTGCYTLAEGETNLTVDAGLYQPGTAKVEKRVKGAAPSGAQSFTFELRDGASTTAKGDILETKLANAANGGNITFATALVPGTYQLCEAFLPVGWLTTLTNGPHFSPESASDPDGYDNSIICVDFTVTSGQTKTFQVNNTPPPQGDARTIGYWKNWSSCSGGNQAPILDETLKATGGITIGKLAVKTCAVAYDILNKSTIDTHAKSSSDPAYNLAAQLLAARLNVARSAGTCTASTNAINSAQTLLAAIGFTGKGSYTTKMTSAQKTQANSLATTLDNYNNNTLC